MHRLAVLGDPVGHSRSPAMQNAALAQLGLGDEWVYEAIEVAPDGFAGLLRGLPAKGFVGVNVTVPHKEAALALADRASPTARRIGAANTLSFADGTIAAENTDAPGLLAALPADPGGRRVLVLGAGGSARAVVWALLSRGAEVSIWNRTTAHAEALAAELGGTVLEPDGELPSGEFEIVVNCTSVGLEGTKAGHAAGRAGGEGGGAHPDLKALRLPADGFHDRQVVVDLVYGSAETALARAARAGGATVVDGLEVLVHQGAESLRIWTGREPPIETMRRAARPPREP